MSQNAINAVLVNFSIVGILTAKVKDKEITAEVTTRHSTSEDAGQWSKSLFPDSMFGEKEPNPYKELRAAVSRAKAYHYEHTLPWEKPLALIKGDKQEEYDNVINVAMRAEVNAALDRFLNAYEGLIDRARIALNGTFRIEDYPAIEKLRAKFAYNVSYSPVPESSHFVDTIASSKLDKLRKELNEANERKVQAALNEAWRRMLEPVQRLAEKMTEPDPTFHDSIINNIRDMIALVPQLNITDDHRLAEAVQQIEETFSTVTPERLRQSQFARVEVAQKAVNLISTFGQLGNRKLATAA